MIKNPFHERRSLAYLCEVWADKAPSPTSVTTDVQKKDPKKRNLKKGDGDYLSRKLTENKKYKTVMCKYMDKRDHDIEKCRFAHSLEELQIPRVPSSYKTVRCKHWWTSTGERVGYCPYSDKCKFVHDKAIITDDKFRKTVGDKFKTKLCDHRYVTSCPFGARCVFKHYDDVEEEDKENDATWLLLPSDLLSI